ncbi:MAG: DUF2232 domain-containing protein, partial [Dolichospermum sp.]
MSIVDSLPEEPEADPSLAPPTQSQLQYQCRNVEIPLKMVETAFLASTSSLIWFINFYFP